MEERTTGRILRTRPLTETSLIVQWLTPDLGRMATVARGARRPKSPFRGKLDLYYLGEFTFQRSRRSELHALREVEIRQTHPGLRQDVGRLQQAAYCAALIEQTTETETPLPEIFALFEGLIETLAGKPAAPANVLAFEIKLLGCLGLAPDPNETKLTPGSRALFQKLAASDWETLRRVRPTETQLVELRQFLHGFLIYHLGRIPEGRITGSGSQK